MPILAQRTQPYTFQSFIGGYMSKTDEDPLMLPKQYIAETSNCLVENGYVRKSLGWLRLVQQGSMNGTLQGIYLYRTADAHEEVLCLTTTNLYKYDPTTGNLVDYTPTGGLSGSTQIAPQFLTWLDNVYITNGVDPIMEHKLGTQATFLTAGGAPLAAMSICVFASQLFALAPTTSVGYQSWTVLWSDFRNPAVWNAGQAGGVELDDTQEAIQAAEITDRWMAIAKTNTWYVTTYIGPPVWFDFRRRDTDAVLCRRTLLRLPAGLGLFALGPDDVIIFDGNNSTPIGKPIRKELFTTLNRLGLDTAVSYLDNLRGRVYLSIPTSTTLTPDLVYSYSYIDGPWMREPGAVLGGASVDYYTDLLIDEMVFSVDSYNVQIGQLYKGRQQRVLTTDGTGLFVMGDYLAHDGRAIDAFFITAAIAPGTQQDGTILPVTVMGILLEGNPLPGTTLVTLRAWWGNMNYRTYGPWPVSFTGPIQVLIPCEVSGSYFQVGVENSNLNEGFQIKQITLRYLIRGRV
jgi:hypothetical protein